MVKTSRYLASLLAVSGLWSIGECPAIHNPSEWAGTGESVGACGTRSPYNYSSTQCPSQTRGTASTFASQVPTQVTNAIRDVSSFDRWHSIGESYTGEYQSESHHDDPDIHGQYPVYSDPNCSNSDVSSLGRIDPNGSDPSGSYFDFTTLMRLGMFAAPTTAGAWVVDKVVKLRRTIQAATPALTLGACSLAALTVLGVLSTGETGIKTAMNACSRASTALESLGCHSSRGGHSRKRYDAGTSTPPDPSTALNPCPRYEARYSA